MSEGIVYFYVETGNGIFRIDGKVKSTQILGIGFQHDFEKSTRSWLRDLAIDTETAIS